MSRSRSGADCTEGGLGVPKRSWKLSPVPRNSAYGQNDTSICNDDVKRNTR